MSQFEQRVTTIMKEKTNSNSLVLNETILKELFKQFLLTIKNNFKFSTKSMTAIESADYLNGKYSQLCTKLADFYQDNDEVTKSNIELELFKNHSLLTYCSYLSRKDLNEVFNGINILGNVSKK
jgi:hypothetical protein